MKINIAIKKAPPCLAAAGALLAAAWAPNALAQSNLLARIALRPVAPTDAATYGMPASTETSGGLSTIAVGTPAYIEAQVNIAFPGASVTNVTWSLTNKPLGSAAMLTNSPLGTNVPIYEIWDRQNYQVVGARTLLRPDLSGQYVVQVTIATTTGTTNITQTITAGSYLGWNQGCIACHSGGLIAPNMTSWTNTEHASMFTRSIDTQVGYSKNCISCHTVGYDTSATEFNGGFNQVAAEVGWVFPSVITNGNWAAMPAALQNVANIQCENCHGPGSTHLIFDGVLGNTNAICVSWDAGDCGQCHDDAPHHVNNPEWNNSMHAVTTTDPAGNATCVGCHTGIGFAQRMSGPVAVTNTSYMPINCQGCHDPHSVTNLHQLRAYNTVTLADTTTVTNAGTAATCMSCHHARVAATNYVDTTAGSTYFGPHEGPQADMFLGVNGYTYGQTIPSSAHTTAVTNSCVTCHMQATPASTAPGFLLVGGHTFNVAYTNGPTNIQYVAVCQQCHGPITNFNNIVGGDYNGDGIIQGVQTEVGLLLNQLAVLLPPIGQAKSSLSINSSWTKQQLRAAYNYEFVANDGSLGVHNTAYAVGLIKASITDLTGITNSTGLMTSNALAFYEWQNEYFGSATTANAAANATPASDGIPNWLKFSLGLNPTIPGTTNSLGGVVWANGTSLVGNNSTNTVEIYTAAEVAFNTQVGVTYQIQSISSLGEGWQNVGTPIAGTGASISYLTQTRKNVQQFFRVMQTP
jgi:hypothetical protein